MSVTAKKKLLHSFFVAMCSKEVAGSRFSIL